jgi:hypothetical protein
MEAEEVRFRKKPTTRFIIALVLTATVGLVLIAVGIWGIDHDSEGWTEGARELLIVVGGALVTGSVLAVSVDQWLKQRLVTEAFQATFGYLLPDVLRAELHWIYSLGLVCTEFRQALS